MIQSATSIPEADFSEAHERAKARLELQQEEAKRQAQEILQAKKLQIIATGGVRDANGNPVTVESYIANNNVSPEVIEKYMTLQSQASAQNNDGENKTTTEWPEAYIPDTAKGNFNQPNQKSKSNAVLIAILATAVLALTVITDKEKK